MNNQETITATHLHEALKIDSIYNVLSWYDRVMIHQFLNNNFCPEDFSDKVNKLSILIAENGFEAPEMRVGQDRLLYFYDVDSYTNLPIEYFIKMNPNITNLIKNL